MDDIGDLMEEDYGKFKKLLKVFVDQAEANRVMKDQGESLTFTKSRKVGPPWKPNDGFRQRLGLDYGFDELSDGLVIGMTFFTNGHYNTSGSTYMNIGRSDTEGGSWVNVVPDFDPSKRMTRLTVRCHPKAAEKLQGPLPESLTRELSEEINGLGLDSDAKPNGAVRGMLDLLVSLHQELERDEMANTSADGLVCKVERDVLASRNVILHGAPGTGKTYLAREVAARIIGCTLDDLDGSGQFGFVQFHPSYDYTDFVEGLRPYTDEQGNVGFRLVEGSFMGFVGRAREAQEPKETPSTGASFDDVWDDLVEDVAVAEGEGKDYTIDTVRGKPLYLRTAGREGDVLCRGGQAPYFNKEQCRNVYRGDKGVPAGGNDSYRRAIVNRLKSDYGLPDHPKEPVPSDEEASKERDDRRFVFVIDEINRGDISKIFGELFFSIDPGYRGPAGSVETQYSNMHDDPGWRFYVPDNVYVIGTMNDIDRNVDTFDFAMRRRFRFVEVTAEESQRMLAGKEGEDEAEARMDELNSLIRGDDDLGESYEIGASYFLGEGGSARDDFEDLWDEQLGPLVREYLRGTRGASEVDEKVEAMRQAFLGDVGEPSAGDSVDGGSEEG